MKHKVSTECDQGDRNHTSILLKSAKFFSSLFSLLHKTFSLFKLKTEYKMARSIETKEKTITLVQQTNKMLNLLSKGFELLPFSLLFFFF